MFKEKTRQNGLGNIFVRGDVGMHDIKNQPAVWQVKHTLNAYEAGTGTLQHWYDPPNRFAGPGVLKLEVTTDKDDSDVSGGFDLILEDL